MPEKQREPERSTDYWNGYEDGQAAAASQPVPPSELSKIEAYIDGMELLRKIAEEKPEMSVAAAAAAASVVLGRLMPLTKKDISRAKEIAVKFGLETAAPSPVLTLCRNRFKLRHGYFCQLPKGHSGDHESECPNSQFHQKWSDDLGAAPVLTQPSAKQKCPKCGGPLEEIKYPSNSPLNRDQWESQLAGNLFCTCHNNHKGNKPYAYFWKSELSEAESPVLPVPPSAEHWLEQNGYPELENTFHKFCEGPIQRNRLNTLLAPLFERFARYCSPAVAPESDPWLEGHNFGFNRAVELLKPAVAPTRKKVCPACHDCKPEGCAYCNATPAVAGRTQGEHEAFEKYATDNNFISIKRDEFGSG